MTTYQVGDRFIIKEEEYILAQFPGMLGLINLETGLRFGDFLEEWGDITEKSINHLAAHHEWYYECY